MRAFVEELFDNPEIDEDLEEDDAHALQLVINNDKDVDPDEDIEDDHTDENIDAMISKISSDLREGLIRTSRGDIDLVRLFLNELNKYPVLTQEEEAVIARRSKGKGPEADRATQLLVLHNLAFVVHTTKKFTSRAPQGVEFIDLIQAGIVGALRAAKKFDPKRKRKFVAYAKRWIKMEIRDLILRNQSLVRIGTQQKQRTVFSNIGKVTNLLRRELSANGIEREPTPEEIAEQIGSGVRAQDVVAIQTRHNISLNTPVGDDEGRTRQDLLEGTFTSPEQSAIAKDLNKLPQDIIDSAFNLLPKRDALVIRLRLLSDPNLTLHQVGKQLGISRERVRQIQVRALENMERYIQNNYPDHIDNVLEWLQERD